MVLRHIGRSTDVDRVTALETNTAFTIRELGYDVIEVNTRIAALEARIAELEGDSAQEESGLVADARFQALRLIMTARQDAEAMVEEARAEAAQIREAADIAAPPSIADQLPPRLAGLLDELPSELQGAFAAVASQRVG